MKTISKRLSELPVRMSEQGTLRLLVDEVEKLEADLSAYKGRNNVIRLGLRTLQRKTETMCDVLEDAQSAIESLDIEALGRVPDSPEWGIGWPIREELLLKIKTALR